MCRGHGLPPYCVARGRRLEARSIEEPDRQPADEDDPEEDEDEGDVRLPFRVIARKEAHWARLCRRAMAPSLTKRLVLLVPQAQSQRALRLRQLRAEIAGVAQLGDQILSQ